MFRSILTATALIAPLSSPVSAQQSEPLSPLMVWERFNETCTHVLTDPNGYLASIENPGPLGDRRISLSPDQKFISVNNRVSNAYDEVYFHIIGTQQLRDCSVIGEFYDTDTSALAQQFVDIIATDQGLTMTGGRTPQDYVSDDGKTIDTYDDFHFFSIDGIWPTLGLVAIVQVIAGELQLSVQHTKRKSQ